MSLPYFQERNCKQPYAEQKLSDMQLALSVAMDKVRPCSPLINATEEETNHISHLLKDAWCFVPQSRVSASQFGLGLHAMLAIV